jgi:hypothetical protein
MVTPYKKADFRHFPVHLPNRFDLCVRRRSQHVRKSQYLIYFSINNLLRGEVWVKL